MAAHALHVILQFVSLLVLVECPVPLDGCFVIKYVFVVLLSLCQVTMGQSSLVFHLLLEWFTVAARGVGWGVVIS